MIWIRQYELHHPTRVDGLLFAVVSRRGSVGKQFSSDAESCFVFFLYLFLILFFFFFLFSRHQTQFLLSRAVVIATHWLAEGSARSLSLDVVNVSWLSEWGNVTAETYDAVHYIPRPTFPGTWNSTSAEFFMAEQIFLTGAHPPGLVGSEGEAPHQF